MKFRLQLQCTIQILDKLMKAFPRNMLFEKVEFDSLVIQKVFLFNGQLSGEIQAESQDVVEAMCSWFPLQRGESVLDDNVAWIVPQGMQRQPFVLQGKLVQPYGFVEHCWGCDRQVNRNNMTWCEPEFDMAGLYCQGCAESVMARRKTVKKFDREGFEERYHRALASFQEKVKEAAV